jgi:hypothetical protein
MTVMIVAVVVTLLLSTADDVVTSLRWGGRRRRRGTIDIEEGGEFDETSKIAGMGQITLCNFEYNNDACFAAKATKDGEDDDGGEGA